MYHKEAIVPQHYSIWCLINLVVCLEHLKDSFYADDAKLCLPIENQNCCNYLQDKTTGFINWCSQIGLDINVDKCKVMSFSKSRNVINFDYKVDGRTIERVNKISDLGVIFNSKLNFNDDCTFRVSKAKSMLGFVKRQVSELQDPDILKSLYCSLVRSNVEYCSQVWSGTSLHNKNRIESIQRKATKMIASTNENYEIRCEISNLMTLEKRRKLCSIMFCFDVIEGYIDSPELLAKMNFFCAPRQLRSNTYLRPDFHRTNYGQAEPVSIMASNFNEVNTLYEPGMNRLNFKKIVKEYLDLNLIENSAI